MEFKYQVSQNKQRFTPDGNSYTDKDTLKTRSFNLALDNILPCPFCASDCPSIHMDFQSETMYVGCIHCGAKGKAYYCEPASRFIDYAPMVLVECESLRNKVNAEYTAYVHSVKLNAVKAWNIRRLDTDDL